MKPQSTQRPPSEVSGIKPHNPTVKSVYIRVIRVIYPTPYAD